MSIWTSDLGKGLGLLALTLSLAACGGGGTRSFAPPPQADTEVVVTSDRITIGGLDGFCVDPEATQDRGITAFVLLGNCAAIANSARLPQPAVPALLTASISEPSEGSRLRDSIPSLGSFFTSENGRRLLSRDDNHETVEVLDSFHQADVFFLHARDSSTGSIEGVREDYWRAYLDLGNRIATLSVLGLAEEEITNDQSLETLRSFAMVVASANGDGGSVATQPVFATQPVEARPAPEPEYQRPEPVSEPASATGGRILRNIGLFRRIFN